MHASSAVWSIGALALMEGWSCKKRFNVAENLTWSGDGVWERSGGDGDGEVVLSW